MMSNIIGMFDKTIELVYNCNKKTTHIHIYKIWQTQKPCYSIHSYSILWFAKHPWFYLFKYPIISVIWITIELIKLFQMDAFYYKKSAPTYPARKLLVPLHILFFTCYIIFFFFLLKYMLHNLYVALTSCLYSTVEIKYIFSCALKYSEQKFFVLPITAACIKKSNMYLTL